MAQHLLSACSVAADECFFVFGGGRESTTLFACFSFQFVTSGLNFGLGSKYRKPLTRNYALIACCAVLCCTPVVIVTAVSWAITRAEPLERLGKHRPTSSLLGPTTIASAAGLTIINTVVTCLAITKMSAHPNYIKFPATLSQGADWWTLGDTW